MTYYRRRLAAAHAAGFTGYAEAAATYLLSVLDTRAGLVIDLGCGDGALAGPVTAAGLDYLGIDLSPDMLVLARDRHPAARFEQRSAFDLAGLPAARAIVAVGEVVNYAADPRAGSGGLTPWLRMCRRLLEPGGVLLLDVAGPMRADPDPATRVVTHEDYRLEVTTSTDSARRVLTRHIRIEDATGEDVEVHELHLIDPLEVMAALGGAGFTASPLASYDPAVPFPRGWSGFLARAILEP
ncbi:MAG TPA: class I SAM-dependent methyltransferase [Actinomycetota bacterium]|nr:class I SAM-dependent methyltransferase [Actinomycetota bacterium]